MIYEWRRAFLSRNADSTALIFLAAFRKTIPQSTAIPLINAQHYPCIWHAAVSLKMHKVIQYIQLNLKTLQNASGSFVCAFLTISNNFSISTKINENARSESTGFAWDKLETNKRSKSWNKLQLLGNKTTEINSNQLKSTCSYPIWRRFFESDPHRIHTKSTELLTGRGSRGSRGTERLRTKSRLLLTDLWAQVVRSTDCSSCDGLQGSKDLQGLRNRKLLENIWKPSKIIQCLEMLRIVHWLLHWIQMHPAGSIVLHLVHMLPKYLTVQKSSTVFNCAKQTTVKSRQTKEVRQVRQVPRVPVLSWELWRCQSPPSSNCLEVCHVDFSHEINCSMWYTQLWGWGHYLVGDYLGWACEGGKIRKNKKKPKHRALQGFILFYFDCFVFIDCPPSWCPMVPY